MQKKRYRRRSRLARRRGMVVVVDCVGLAIRGASPSLVWPY